MNFFFSSRVLSCPVTGAAAGAAAALGAGAAAGAATAFAAAGAAAFAAAGAAAFGAAAALEAALLDIAAAAADEASDGPMGGALLALAKA
mmetsp:Transcript_34462/g.112198  ORF Transcript_34462/g.112198 Transcript_34462/m.112198 type:complete len:90 (+) Transcript_34462:3177-3446(+)